MLRVLITGATGNVGKEVVHSLLLLNKQVVVIAGVRNTQQKFFNDTRVQYQLFDFEDIAGFRQALSCCDVLFLLRPPQISNVKKYFVPLIEAAALQKVQHIVFLSVQGVQTSRYIPHYRIEKVIVDSGIPYTFIRPAYFMQNFTTTLRKDLVDNDLIYLPAGKARFTLIDTADAGLAAACIITDLKSHINKAYDLTNSEKLNFDEMAQKISAGINRKIIYRSPNLLQFYWHKRKQHAPAVFIFIMIMLHYFPRFRKPPEISNNMLQLTGKAPRLFDEFVSLNKKLLTCF